jgi:hypothetical protein
MTINVHATYRDGLIYPAVPLNLPDNTPVEVTIVANDKTKSSTSEGDPPQVVSPRFTRDQLRQRIAQHGVSVGTLPVDFSRADIYSDHD